MYCDESWKYDIGHYDNGLLHGYGKRVDHEGNVQDGIWEEGEFKENANDVKEFNPNLDKIAHTIEFEKYLNKKDGYKPREPRRLKSPTVYDASVKYGMVSENDMSEGEQSFPELQKTSFADILNKSNKSIPSNVKRKIMGKRK